MDTLYLSCVDYFGPLSLYLETSHILVSHKVVARLTLSPANEQILNEIRQSCDQPKHPHYIRKYETLFRLLHKANEATPHFDVFTIEVQDITVFKCNRLVGRLYLKF